MLPTLDRNYGTYCDVLRDAGLSYGDYLEQLTYLIFLKMMDELNKPPFTSLTQLPFRTQCPKIYDWSSLMARDGVELELHYTELLLENAGWQVAWHNWWAIFRGAQNKIHEPAMLTRLIKVSHKWRELDASSALM